MKPDYGEGFLESAQLLREKSLTPEQLAQSIRLRSGEVDEEEAKKPKKKEIKRVNQQFLFNRRMIPIGKTIEEGKPIFYRSLERSFVLPDDCMQGFLSAD